MITGSLLVMLGATINIDAVRSSAAITVGSIAAFYCISEVWGVRLPVPSGGWMVPKSVVPFHPRATAFVFGVLLGLGFLTIIPFIGYHLTVVSLFVKGNSGEILMLMATFGLSRSIPVVVPALLVTDKDSMDNMLLALQRTRALWLAVVLSLASLAGSMFALAITTHG